MNSELAELLFPNIQKTVEDYKREYPERNLKENAVVTRFAPSPTGKIHIGSLYAAFIGSAFAHQSDGIFYLRIEDTDHKREIENGIEIIKQDLKDFKIDIDEGPDIGGIYGPYIQSQRKEIYQAFVKYLVEIGYAYPCFYTEEETQAIKKEQEEKKERIGIYGKWAKYRDITLEETKKLIQEKEYIIRLKSPGNFNRRIKCKDVIKGTMELPENDMDVVILKKDGLPTYHFAHVVDDYLMHTTHVIRGDEWLSSLPIHLQLFELLDLPVPKFAHISPLTKKEGESVRKLSKRKDKEATIHYYHELGIPSEAIKLYFATLINANFENFYMQDKTNKIEDFHFEFSKMSTGGTMFDLSKLENLSKLYFSREKADKIYEELLTYTKTYDDEFYQILIAQKEYTLAILNIERNQKNPRKDISCYHDIKALNYYFFDEYFHETTNPYQKIAIETYPIDLLENYFINIYKSEDTEEIWYQKIKEYCNEINYASSMKQYKENPEQYKGHIGSFCELIRVVMTGELESPNLYQVLQVLGIEKIQKRINLCKNIQKRLKF